MIGAVARGVVSRLWLALARGTPGRIPEDQRHHWQEKHGLGGGWTCDRCKKPASACYGRERFYCSGAPERIVIVPSPRPEDDGDDFRVDGVRIDWPTYHVLLNHLCTELGVPGAQSFWQAVAWVKKRAPQ